MISTEELFQRIQELDDKVKCLERQIVSDPDVFIKYLIEEVGLVDTRAYPLGRAFKYLHKALTELDNNHMALLRKEGIHGAFLTYCLLEEQREIDLDSIEEK